MLVFPNCKINLGLNVVARRSDGYHDLETVFYPIELRDALEAIQSPATQFAATGLHIDGSPGNNLCIKAYNILKNDYPQLPNLSIHLHKVIPMGAGLGGGSSDGASMLLLINKKFGLQIPTEKLCEYALQLGSDCPFFIINKPSFATGRGEKMQAVNIDLSTYCILIVNPGIHVSTRQAFAGLSPTVPKKSIAKVIMQPIESWKNELVNDFEATIFPIYPEIERIKTELYAMGAVYASMTGTGSTVYGIFPTGFVCKSNHFSAYFTQWI